MESEDRKEKTTPARAMYLVGELLNYIGEDPEREGLKETPKRVIKMYEEIFSGYRQDPERILEKTFNDENHHELVIVKEIKFFSHCEHHMVPFHGVVHIGYIPNGSVVGISKLARLVECFARRLQIQERMTSQIADTIVKVLQPQGVAVVVEAEHMCMTMRGVKAPGTKTVTAAMRGEFHDDVALRNEFYSLIGGRK